MAPRGFESLSLRQALYWPVGEAVNTPAFHAGMQGFESPTGHHFWKFSSAGRAPALQAGGRRFDPVNFHHIRGAVV